MNLSHDLADGRALTAQVEAPLASVAAGLLARLVPHAVALTKGEATMVELDWAPLRLTANSTEVTVEEPDYTGDPTRFVASLTRTSQIFAVEQQLTTLFDVAPEPISAAQYIHVATEALSASSVVGSRQHDPEHPFTGWRIVSAAADGAQQLGLYTSRELVRDHPAWFCALALPPGWGFRFIGDDLVSVESAAGGAYTLILKPLDGFKMG